MQIKISIQPEARTAPFAASETRARQLLKTFISECYADELIQHPEIQRQFLHWLENRETIAARQTQREELKAVNRAAKNSEAPLPLVEKETEKRLLDTRNNIAQVSQKVAISRVFDQTTLQQMQEVLQSNKAFVTQTKREAFIVFAATLMTGLRPSEWHEAVLYQPRQNPQLVSEEATLWVRTAKSRNNEERERNLVLHDFTNADLSLIASATEIGHSRTRAQVAQFSAAIRKLGLKVADTAEKSDAMALLELSSARKLYAVEAIRDGFPKEEVAAVLGHTSTNNLRWYIQGDTDGPRQGAYPLAQADEQAVMGIRDPLENLFSRKEQTDPTPDDDLGVR